MTKVSEKQAQRQEAMDYLLKELAIKPGDKLHTILRHVSSSGMSRRISVIYHKDGEPYDITRSVARILDCPTSMDYEGLKIGGCGMDMGFHLVYNLASILWPNGFDCIGEHCPSNDHMNREQNAHHADGGYALTRRWL